MGSFGCPGVLIVVDSSQSQHHLKSGTPVERSGILDGSDGAVGEGEKNDACVPASEVMGFIIGQQEVAAVVESVGDIKTTCRGGQRTEDRTGRAIEEHVGAG